MKNNFQMATAKINLLKYKFNIKLIRVRKTFSLLCDIKQINCVAAGVVVVFVTHRLTKGEKGKESEQQE
jgi:hypothetical protein